MGKKTPEAATSENTTINTQFGDVDNKSFDVKATAEDVLKNGDPIKYILDVFNTLHIGDHKIGELLILSAGAGCVANCAGIHPKLSGESGKGKSHACKTMLHLIPKKYAMNTSLSGKALYYIKIVEGTIVFSDDVTLSDDLESLLRRSTSEFQQGIEHTTVDTNRTAKILHVPPRIVWWLASVNDELDMQTLNRQVGVGVDESPEIDRLVLEHQSRIAMTGELDYPETDEVNVCREIFSKIKEIFTQVVIPFADRIEWRGGNNRRNYPIFLDMIKVYALFNYQQRERVRAANGKFKIMANERDFASAAALYQDRAETQATKLTANELKIIDFLASYGTADTNQIAKAVGGSYQTTRRLLIGRNGGNGGLLGKIKGLEVEDMTRETDGGTRRIKEFFLVGHDRLSSYGNIVSLKEV